MKDQSYTNHRRYVPGFHFVLLAFLVISFAASVFFLVRSFVHEIDRVSASISFLLSLSFSVYLFLCKAIYSYSAGQGNKGRREPSSFCFNRQTSRYPVNNEADSRAPVCLRS